MTKWRGEDDRTGEFTGSPSPTCLACLMKAEDGKGHVVVATGPGVVANSQKAAMLFGLEATMTTGKSSKYQ